MNRQMTLSRYRALDIGIFSALLCLIEVLAALGSRIWFPQELYTLSLTAAVCALVMVRWGLRAMIPAALGGMAFCIASGAKAEQYLIYILGNLCCAAVYPMVQKDNWQRVRENVLLCMLYGCLMALAMQLGRAAVALVCGYDVAVCLMFLTTDVISTLFSVVLCWIARRLDGVMEEQKHYLLRIQKEIKEEQAKARGMDV